MKKLRAIKFLNIDKKGYKIVYFQLLNMLTVF